MHYLLQKKNDCITTILSSLKIKIAAQTSKFWAAFMDSPGVVQNEVTGNQECISRGIPPGMAQRTNRMLRLS